MTKNEHLKQCFDNTLYLEHGMRYGHVILHKEVLRDMLDGTTEYNFSILDFKILACNLIDDTYHFYGICPKFDLTENFEDVPIYVFAIRKMLVSNNVFEYYVTYTKKKTKLNLYIDNITKQTWRCKSDMINRYSFNGYLRVKILENTASKITIQFKRFNKNSMYMKPKNNKTAIFDIFNSFGVTFDLIPGDKNRSLQKFKAQFKNMLTNCGAISCTQNCEL